MSNRRFYRKKINCFVYLTGRSSVGNQFRNSEFSCGPFSQFLLYLALDELWYVQPLALTLKLISFGKSDVCQH